MRRYNSPPVHLLELERNIGPTGKTYSHAYVPPGGEGDMTHARMSLTLLFWPAGWTQPWGKTGQFEYHMLHEEVFFLSGTMNYDNIYKVSAPGYLNYPPLWCHPTNHWSEADDGPLTMIMRTSYPPIVRLADYPPDWNHQIAPAPATRSIATRNLQLDDLAWSRLATRDGVDTGIDAKRIAEDRDDGWTTWMMRVPPGWRAPGGRVAKPGGDEFYVVEGDLALDGSAPTVLSESGYVCDVETIRDGDGYLSSRAGATFLRWTRGAEQVWRVAPQV